jgi:hypothetical protein
MSALDKMALDAKIQKEKCAKCTRECLDRKKDVLKCETDVPY